MSAYRGLRSWTQIALQVCWSSFVILAVFHLSCLLNTRPVPADDRHCDDYRVRYVISLSFVDKSELVKHWCGMSIINILGKLFVTLLVEVCLCFVVCLCIIHCVLSRPLSGQLSSAFNDWSLTDCHGSGSYDWWVPDIPLTRVVWPEKISAGKIIKKKWWLSATL